MTGHQDHHDSVVATNNDNNSNINNNSTSTFGIENEKKDQDETDACVFIKANHYKTKKRRTRISSKVVDEITSRSFIDWNFLLADVTATTSSTGVGVGIANENGNCWQEEIEQEQKERMMEYARISLVDSVCEPPSSSIVEVFRDNSIVTKVSSENNRESCVASSDDSITAKNLSSSSSSVEHLMERISNDITRRVSIMEKDLLPLHHEEDYSTLSDIATDDDDYDKRCSYASSAFSSMDDDDDGVDCGDNDDEEEENTDAVNIDHHGEQDKIVEVPECTKLNRETSIETHRFRWGSSRMLPTKRNSNETQESIRTKQPTITATATTDKLEQSIPDVVAVNIPFELQGLDQQHRASATLIDIRMYDDDDFMAHDNDDGIIMEEDDDEVDFDSHRAIKTVKKPSTTSQQKKKKEERKKRRPGLHRDNAKRIHIDQYNGSYNSKGQRHGKGTLKLSNGDIFEGTFNDGKKDGIGTLIYHDGSTYKGGWKNDLYHGYGVRQYPDGYTYYGSYVNGVCHGHGQCDFVNGDRYFGNWKDGHMDGHGKYHSKNGELYEGMLVKGKREGPGRIHLRNGKLDVMQFVGDEVVGLGVRWSRSRLKAYKLDCGVVVGKKISVEEAREIELLVYGDDRIQSTLGSTHVTF